MQTILMLHTDTVCWPLQYRVDDQHFWTGKPEEVAEYRVQNQNVADGHHSIQKQHASIIAKRSVFHTIIIDPILQIKLLCQALLPYPNDELRPGAVSKIRGAPIPKQNTFPVVILHKLYSWLQNLISPVFKILFCKISLCLQT